MGEFIESSQLLFLSSGSLSQILKLSEGLLPQQGALGAAALQQGLEVAVT